MLDRQETRKAIHDFLPSWFQRLIPEQDIQTKEDIIPFGKMWIGTANYGELVDNTTLVNETTVIDSQGQRELTAIERGNVEALIGSTGIKTRYRSPRELDGVRTQEMVIDDAGRLGAYLLHKTILESGMIPDHIIVTNLDLPISLNAAVKRHSILLPKDVTDESVRAACAGGLLGIIKAMADPSLRNKTVAVVSIEPTGHLQDDRHYTPEHIAIPAIFTDMYSVVILRPSDFELMDFAIEVIPGGGIDVKTSYDEKVTLEQDEIPEWLQNHITFLEDAGKPSILRINNKGIFLDIKPPDNGMTATMNGVETGLHFSRYGAAFINKFVRKNVNRFTSFLFTHQPSLAVIKKINKILRIEEGYLDNTLPFDLPDMETGNGTSAVTVKHLQYIAKTRNPDPTHNFVGITMGIGSVLAAIQMRQKAA